MTISANSIVKWVLLIACCVACSAARINKSNLKKHAVVDNEVDKPSEDAIAKAFDTMIAQKMSGDVASNSVPTSVVKTCNPVSFSALKATFARRGDPNPNYVATTEQEAALFPNFFWEHKKKDQYNEIIRIMKSRILHWAGRHIIRILNFRRMLERKLRLPHSRYLHLFGRQSGRMRKSVSGNSVTTIRDCYNAGTADPATQNVRICTSCMATTVLPENRFPRYINEVVCKASAPVCFQGEGYCTQKRFSMTFMYKTGNCVPITQDGKTIHIEEWIPSQQSLGTCCECQIRPSSWLKFML